MKSAERYFQHTLPNGLTLLCERMPAMQSSAMTLLLPAGSSTDPTGARGCATICVELVLRGAGNRDNRQLTEYLDGLGLQRGNSVGTYHTRFSAAGIAANVLKSLDAYGDIVMRPMMPEAAFGPARDLALQSLAGLDDDPRQRLLIRLREKHLPPPFGLTPMGIKEDIERLTLDFVRKQRETRYKAAGAILAIAGNVNFAEVRARVEEVFSTLDPSPAPIAVPAAPARGATFEHATSEQTHIGIAWQSVPETHPDYYVARLIAEVLGGGMSSRLFAEVREKRGLCYSVSASYSSLKEQGAMFGYAGTSNDRAQETLDTFIAEVRRLEAGVSAGELERARIGLKASTIMSGESTSARAGAIAYDYFTRGHIRDLEEIKRALDSVTLDQVNTHLRSNPAGPFTVVVLGPKELTVPL